MFGLSFFCHPLLSFSVLFFRPPRGIIPVCRQHHLSIAGAGMSKQNLIGTYAERTVHALLKCHFELDIAYHEVAYAGYIADIKRGDSIVEIQSTQFYRLRSKLKAFTAECSVNVVYPVPHRKQIVWIDRKTGEVSKPRLSPKKGSVYSIFPELVDLHELLLCPSLSFTVVLLNMTEYRYTSPDEKYPHSMRFGARRADRLPTEIVDTYTLSGRESYTALIPESLGGSFTISELAEAAKISYRTAQKMTTALRTLGILCEGGRRGRQLLLELK